MNPLLEVATVFVLAECAIWTSVLSRGISIACGVIAGLLVLIHWIEAYSPAEIRSFWKPNGMRSAYAEFGALVVLFSALIALIGFYANPHVFSTPHLVKRFAISVGCYLGNALWQQLLVLGYFLPRLEKGVDHEWTAYAALGCMFALVHIPNPVLVPVTLIGGMLCAYYYRKTRNIYLIILAHSVLAVGIMYLFPAAWHHHLRIGPGFWRWHP
ncbi:CPBP family intramembrane metalloprotease [Patescibacteria group bacterium]|nr:CPBP family intramembrane metalloprotease [Patescibacteria group bacterium]